MSFLNQLKSQANAVQTSQSMQGTQAEANTLATEMAAKTAWLYLVDLARQLNVIQPAGPKISLDGKTPWPTLQLGNFTSDSRKKTLRNKEVFDTLSIGWTLAPTPGQISKGSVSADFPPELNRIESRLAAGRVPHERVNVRHPVKNTLQAIRFDYELRVHSGVTVSCEHDVGQFSFRLANLTGLEILNKTYPANQINSGLLDELAKLICGQPSQFL